MWVIARNFGYTLESSYDESIKLELLQSNSPLAFPSMSCHKQRMKTPLPLRLMQEIGKRFPDVWRKADFMRSMKGSELPEWNGDIFLPQAAWIDIGKEILGKAELDVNDIFFIQLVAAVAAWRPAQDIIRYDRDVYQSLVEMPLDGTLPSQILVHLPSWCIYVDTPDGIEVEGDTWSGFFAMSGYDARHGIHILRILFLKDNFGLLIKDIPLGEWNLRQALEFLRNKAEASLEVIGVKLPVSDSDEYAGVRSALNLLIYLCAYGVSDKEGAGLESAHYPTPQKVKTGWRLFPPDKPRVVILGTAFGEKIRSVSHSDTVHGSHQGPRPHIRRALWHSYWTGPKEERRLVPRWLPPIPVAMVDDDKEP